WRPNFSDGANDARWKHNGSSSQESSRENYLGMIADALSDTTSRTLVVLGEHGDDRVELVRRAHKITPHLGNLVHVVGTAYAQNMRYGALAFLLADLETAVEPGAAEIMKAISRRISSGDRVGLVVLEYPQL